MAFETEKIGDQNDAKLSELGGKFSQLAEQINQHPEHPLYPEFQRISTQAESLLARMGTALRMPGSTPVLTQMTEQLSQLHEKAVSIRARIVSDNINTSFNVRPGSTVEATLEKELDTIVDTAPNLFGKLKPRALDIIRNVSRTGETFSDGRANRYFLKTRNGSIGVNFDEINKDLAFVKQLRETNNPQMMQLADRLETGIQQVTAADPFQRAAHNEWEKQVLGSTFNTRPLKVIGGLTAGLITTMGLAQTIFTKGHKLSPATVGWGVAFLAATGMLKSGQNRALDFIASVGSPDVARFAPAFNKQSFNELQDIARSNNKDLKTLQKTDQPITQAQVNTLTGNNPNSALAKTLSQIPEEDRATALLNLGRKMDIGQRELMEALLA